MVPQQKNAGLKVTEVSQEDATLNFIVLKNVKSLNSENLRNWIFFFSFARNLHSIWSNKTPNLRPPVVNVILRKYNTACF